MLAFLSGLDLAGLALLAVVLLAAMFRKGKTTFGFGKGSVTIEDVHDKLDKIQTTANQVNAAVNNVKPGEPTLLERLQVIEATMVMHQDRLKQVGLNAVTARDEARETRSAIRDLRDLVVKVLERR